MHRLDQRPSWDADPGGIDGAGEDQCFPTEVEAGGAGVGVVGACDGGSADGKRSLGWAIA